MLAAAYALVARKTEDPQRKQLASEMAHTYFKASIEAGRQIGAKSALGKAYLNWGYLHHQQGNMDRAGGCFRAAIKFFRRCHSDANIERAQQALVALDRMTQDRDQMTEAGKQPAQVW